MSVTNVQQKLQCPASHASPGSASIYTGCDLPDIPTIPLSCSNIHYLSSPCMATDMLNYHGDMSVTVHLYVQLYMKIGYCFSFFLTAKHYSPQKMTESSRYLGML